MKNYLRKLAFITFFGMIISGCEKELYEDALLQDQITYEKFSFSKDGKFNIVLSQHIIAFKSRSKTTQENGVSNRMVYDSIFNFYFDDENGIHIQDGDYDSYTFPVYKLNSDEKLNNLVFSENETGSYDSYYVKYNITKEELNTLTPTEIGLKKGDIEKLNYSSNATETASRRCFELVLNPRHFRPVPNATTDPIVMNSSPYTLVEVDCGDGGSGGSSSGPGSGSSGSGSGSSGSGTGSSGSGSGSSGSGSGSSGSGSGSGSGSDSSGGGGGGGGSSTNNNTVITVPLPYPDDDGVSLAGNTGPPTTPCEELKKLSDPTRTQGNIKPKVALLKQKVESANNYNEISSWIRKASNAIVYTSGDYPPGTDDDVDIEITETQLGILHSHTNKKVGMYSFNDVLTLRDMYGLVYGSRKAESFSLLVCKDASGATKYYNIKVDNYIELNNYVNNMLSDNNHNGALSDEDAIDAIHKKQELIYGKEPNQDYEKSFLKQFKDFGIALYSASDENLTDWKKLTIDPNPNNPAVKTPCN